MHDRQPVHIVGRVADWGAEFPLVAARRRAEGREALAAYATPVLRDGVAIGYVLVIRDEPRPFTERQMALVQTFADQAMIAIENARLFDEVQERTRELEERNAALTEGLEREQATSDILRIISRAPGNRLVTLQAIADATRTLCRADGCRVRLVDGEDLVDGPASPPEDEFGARPRGTRQPISDNPLNAEALQHGAPVHVADLLAHVEASGYSAEQLAYVRAGDQRTGLGVPLMVGGTGVGVLTLMRQRQVRPFSAQEIALAETFAAQAVIALENARLFEEVQARTRELEERNIALAETLEHQRASGEVLELISRAPSDLQAVLDGIVERAARLLELVHEVAHFVNLRSMRWDMAM